MTVSQLFQGNDNYGFDPKSGKCVDEVVNDGVIPFEWYRVRVTKPGFDPGIFYRFHTGYDEDCDTVRCAIVDKDGSILVPGRHEHTEDYCHSEHFLIWPEGGHEGAPDLLPDPRVLQEHYFQCVYLPGGNRPGAGVPDTIGLRASLSAANAGDSDLWLEQLRGGGNCGSESNPNPCPDGFHCHDGRCAPDGCDPASGAGCPPELTCGSDGRCTQFSCSSNADCPSRRCDVAIGTCRPPTIQKLFDSDTGALSRRVVLRGGFEFHEEHRHLHFDDFGLLNLVDRLEPGCDQWPTRPSDCVVAGGEKISFCILDSRRFDLDVAVRDTRGDSFFFGCNSHTQGISRGWQEVYEHHLAGQVVVLGDVGTVVSTFSSRALWLEGIIDPEDVLLERTTLGLQPDPRAPFGFRQRQERQNNRARIAINFPSLSLDMNFQRDLCDASRGEITDAVTELDCSRCRCGDVDGIPHSCGNLWISERKLAEMCSDYLETCD